MKILRQSLPSKPLVAHAIGRRIQFSLRSFMVALTAACVGGGWWMNQVWRQYDAVAAVLEAGGYVRYPALSLRKFKPYEPRSYAVTEHDDHFWSDFINSPLAVYFHDTEVDDRLFHRISSLSRLECVQCDRCRITNPGFARLSRLKALKWLSLDGARITDEGLLHLKSLNQLDVVALGNSEITDRGLEHLTGLKKLEVLYLEGTKVTDKGARQFKNAVPGCCVFLNRIELDPPSE